MTEHVKISLSEAVHIAGQDKNKYRAFEKLEEVLTVALQAEQTIRELTAKKKTMDAEMQADETDFLKVKKERADKVLDLGKRIKTLEDDVAEKMTWKEDTINRISKEMKKRESIAFKRGEESDKKHAECMEVLKQKESKLELEISKLQKIFDGMVSKVDNVKQQIMGVV